MPPRPLPRGCDVCAANEDRLEPADLAATGIVHSFATVHLGKPAPPFSVADVRLDDGPLIRGMVSAATPARMTTGIEGRGGLLPPRPRRVTWSG
ncbi:MAG TPA: hypothetical protein VG388_03890 [Solirubrobacteraceae bacterium]|nr:hypothetical protein [Solirubrobacteraceae bacterium]